MRATPILSPRNGVFTGQFFFYVFVASFSSTFSRENWKRICVCIHSTIMTKRKSKYYQNMRKTYLKVKIRRENLSKNKLVCKKGLKIVDCGAGLGGGEGGGGY